ncbi:MAG: ribonuclease E/G, partial [Nitrospinaceae bacterium]|nr:ribonuclease E/G [Nitrospinaceae bacterium]
IYQRKVLLPSGGSIVIDIGEAMVSIDVNSGKTKGGLDLEETALTTNLEAAKEVARQLRLRDLGGLIVIDFIDMYQKRNKTAVEKEVKQSCKTDKARINLARISKFGLLEMSRQRISPPVKEGVFTQCEHCAGSGLVRSMDSIILNVLRKIHETIAKEKVKILSLEVSPEVSNYFLNNKLNILAELKTKHLVDFRFQIKQGLSFEDFKYKVSEVWESESVQEAKSPEKASSKPRRTVKPAIKAEEDAVKSKIKVDGEDTEKKEPENAKPNPKRRYARRRPTARRGAQRGRYRSPNHTSKREEGTPVDNATPEPKDKTTLENNEFSKGNSSGDINSPMPPMPRPFIREGQNLSGEQPPVSNEPASPADGTTGD